VENMMKVGYTFTLTKDESILRKGEKVHVTEIQPQPDGAWVKIESKDHPTYTAWLFVKTGKEREAFGQKTETGR
jgi:hypothetical protein